MTSKYEEVLSGILGTVARKQKIANFVLFLALASTLIWFQSSIDAKDGFFLQGYGFIVYVITGLAFLAYWALISLAKLHDDKFVIIIDKGNFVSTRDPLAIKLIEAYLNVTQKLNINAHDYSLICKKSRERGAFSTGLSRNKTVCIYAEMAAECESDELEAVMAHEFGHLINKDVVTATIRGSLSCFLNLVGGLTGFIIVWMTWGFLNAALFLSITGVIIPLITSHSSRIGEEFADLFATKYGYGKGLRSFLSRIPRQYSTGLAEIFFSHPAIETRLEYILKFMMGDDGKIRDKTEHLLWTIGKIIFLGVGVTYLALHGVSVIGFLLAGAMFFLSDIFMSNNPGFSHINEASSVKPTSFKGWLSLVVGTVVIIGLYVAGIFAAIYFQRSESAIVSTLSLIAIIFWSAKPLAGLFRDSKSDLVAAISEISTYLTFVASLVMMASCFVVF